MKDLKHLFWILLWPVMIIYFIGICLPALLLAGILNILGFQDWPDELSIVSIPLEWHEKLSRD